MGFLFGVRGRINRAKWWGAALIYVLVEIVVGAVIAGAIFSAIAALPKPDPVAIVRVVLGFGGVGIVLLIIGLIMLVSGICVGVKRLHDRDKSGWWLVIFYVFPAALSGAADSVQMQTGSPSSGVVLGLASLAIVIWGFVELGCLRGTPGPNRFGPDPLGGG
jgi:uncharacterized membrane protein YhaH (DUF805 family)